MGLRTPANVQPVGSHRRFMACNTLLDPFKPDTSQGAPPNAERFLLWPTVVADCTAKQFRCMERRTFLNTSASLAGGVVLSGATACAPAMRPAPATPLAN